jgi:hypothetical protein
VGDQAAAVDSEWSSIGALLPPWLGFCSPFMRLLDRDDMLVTMQINKDILTEEQREKFAVEASSKPYFVVIKVGFLLPDCEAIVDRVCKALGG